MAAGRGFRVALTDNNHDLYAALPEAFGHFDRHRVASAGRRDQRAVFRRDLEIAEDALREAGNIFQEHRLPLAVRANDGIVKGEREFDNRVEAGEGTVTRPHLFHEDSAVARTE